MIKSFESKNAWLLFNDRPAPKLPPDLQKIARRKLAMVAAAKRIEDLRLPPGNRLEALRGDRVGQWSIRLNDQWRLCFAWHDGDAYEVDIVDYH
ncbi:MAG: type II toxin-antitoxin system RelE/ParE family toxin [Candidatus Symbiobacter sp.]|nr:type II toxin-antitoxin system RelE/ParE family toxin [Candidatus Symbiobacter sp.]